MQPGKSEQHYDGVLSALSTAYLMEDKAYVATKAFPIVPVKQSTGKYTAYSQDAFLRDEFAARVPGAAAVRSGYGVTRPNYSLTQFALSHPIADEERRDQTVPLDAEADTVQWLVQKALLRMEIDWAAAFFTTGVWGTDITPGVLWSTYATSDPIIDVRTGMRTVQQNTGMRPNTLVMSQNVFDVLQDHPDFLSRVTLVTSVAQGQVISTEIMAQIFGIDRVLVAAAVKATADEGAAAQTYAFTHGKHALLCYSAPHPGLKTPSAGYTLMLNGDGPNANHSGSVADTPANVVSIYQYRDVPSAHADVIEGQVEFQNLKVAANLGYFFNGAIA